MQNQVRQHSRTSARDRLGWTLIEMTVLISLLGTFSLIGISLLTRFMEIDTAIATSAAYEISMERLEDQLRQDTNSARSATLVTEDGITGIDLIDPTGVPIAYRIAHQSITRSITGESRTSRETFPFNDAEINMEILSNLIKVTIIKREPLELKSPVSQLQTRPNVSIQLLFSIGRRARYITDSPANGVTT